MYTDSYSRIRVPSLVRTLRTAITHVMIALELWESHVLIAIGIHVRLRCPIHYKLLLVSTHNVGLVAIQHSLFTPLPHSLYQAFLRSTLFYVSRNEQAC